MSPIRWWPPASPHDEPRDGLSFLVEWRSAGAEVDDVQRLASFVVTRFGADTYFSLSGGQGVAIARFRSDTELAEASLALWRFTGARPRVTPVVATAEMQRLLEGMNGAAAAYQKGTPGT